MRRERMTAATFLIAVLLAVLISFSAVMCLEDAFQHLVRDHPDL